MDTIIKCIDVDALDNLSSLRRGVRLEDLKLDSDFDSEPVVREVIAFEFKNGSVCFDNDVVAIVAKGMKKDLFKRVMAKVSGIVSGTPNGHFNIIDGKVFGEMMVA